MVFFFNDLSSYDRQRHENADTIIKLYITKSHVNLALNLVNFICINGMI